MVQEWDGYALGHDMYTFAVLGVQVRKELEEKSRTILGEAGTCTTTILQGTVIPL